MTDIKKIAISINSISEDINAEVIIADLMEKGFPPEKLMVKLKGQFVRNFSKDVSDTYADMMNDLLVLYITRQGLYDILPAGLFHQITGNFDGENRKAEFEKLRKQETNARKFFLPFDNEFFLQHVHVEMELRDYLRDISSFLRDLFSFDIHIPEKFTLKFLSCLLYADQTILDPKLAALLLSDIIEEDVTCSVRHTTGSLDTIDEEPRYFLGEGILGNKSFCSGSPQEGRHIWEFTIHLGRTSDIQPYIELKASGLKAFLDIFYEYFTPLEIVATTRIECDYVTSFYLGSAADLPNEEKLKDIPELFLGYNTMI